MYILGPRARGQKFTTCLFATKRTGCGRTTRYKAFTELLLMMMGKNKEVKIFGPIFQKYSMNNNLFFYTENLTRNVNLWLFFMSESSEKSEKK